VRGTAARTPVPTIGEEPRRPGARRQKLRTAVGALLSLAHGRHEEGGGRPSLAVGGGGRRGVAVGMERRHGEAVRPAGNRFSAVLSV
jgi:hypothetical protein